MFKDLSDYIEDNTFKFTIYEHKIHILNFKKLITIEENFFSFATKYKKIKVTGEQFTLKRLLKDELLITGIITKIEVVNG